jgi:hypothetical protein
MLGVFPEISICTASKFRHRSNSAHEGETWFGKRKKIRDKNIKTEEQLLQAISQIEEGGRIIIKI